MVRSTADDVPRASVMRRDYFAIRREQDPQRKEQALKRSALLREQRRIACSKLKLDVAADLPMADHTDELLELLQQHQVLVVAGETGSGKTTQLPKLCLQLGLGVGGMIAHTQPRRLAARTVAKRIAEEVGATLGEDIGYAVRFSDQVSDRSLLKVLD